MDSDEMLVDSYRKGDEEAFASLIRKYTRHLYNFIRQYVRSEGEAEDIVQETFIKAWKHIRRFDAKKSFKVWIFTIARNTVIDSLRKKKETLFADIEDESGTLPDFADEDAPIPEEVFATKEIREIVEKAFGILPLRVRETLILYYQEGLNFREIAEVSGEPLDTVRSRHRRGLHALKKKLLESRLDAPKRGSSAYS